jgi:ADP-heptose:LPS heptosyltransferase
LTLARKLLGSPPLANPARPRSILFVKLAEQGSTVLAIPTIRRAVEMVGRQNVYFLVFEENRFILDVIGLVPEENVVTIRPVGILALATSALKAIWRLRRLRLDAAVDMEFFSRGSAALAFLSGARARVGLHAFYGGGPYRGDLMTHRLTYNPHLHTTTAFQIMVDALTVAPAKLPVLAFEPPPASFDFPSFVPRSEDIETIRSLLPVNNGRAVPVILLNPNASDLLPLRQWPRQRYVELAIRLLDRFPDIGVVFTGPPIEAATIESLAREVNNPRCLSLAGKTTLRQLMTLYTLSEIMVTNDSGPAHFATLTPMDVVTLFGPETPALFAAQTARNVPLWAGIACSPCVNAFNNRQSTCKDNVCMKHISVEQVFSAVCRIHEKKCQSCPTELMSEVPAGLLSRYELGRSSERPLPRL